VNGMIIFTDHAKDKLVKELNKLDITERTTTEIIREPDELLYDSLTNRFVAIRWSRKTAVIYEKDDNNFIVCHVKFLTLHSYSSAGNVFMPLWNREWLNHSLYSCNLPLSHPGNFLRWLTNSLFRF